MGKEHAKAEQRYLAALAGQIPEETMERRRQQEQAYSMIRSALGREGTYEAPAAGLGAAAPAAGAEAAGEPGAGVPDLFQKASLGRTAGFAYGGGKKTAGLTIDPAAVAKATMESPEFRMASRMTAEAEQLLKREGPLWDEMNKSVMGNIIEGASAQKRENAEALRRLYAKGGAARNRANQAIQEIRANERVNAIKQQNLWGANLALNQWSRDNARRQLEFNQDWAANTAGIRETFHDALDRAGEVFVGVALPETAKYATQAQTLSEEIHAENRVKANRIYKIAISAVATVAGGIGGGLAGGIMKGVGGGGTFAGVSAGTYGKVAGWGLENLLSSTGVTSPDAFGGALGTIGQQLFSSAGTPTGTYIPPHLRPGGSNLLGNVITSGPSPSGGLIT